MIDPKIVDIDISGNEIYESAALLFATIAYPLDVNARRQFEQALCLQALTTRANADAGWANMKQPIKPALLLDQHELRKAYRKGMNVLNRKRMIALQMASPTYSAFERMMRTKRVPKAYVRPTSKTMIDRTAATLAATCAYRGRRPRCPAHGDHVIRSMTTGAAHELDGAVGFIF